MNANIKKLINPILFIAVGLFNFIFLALNALSVSASYGSVSYSTGLCSGYKILSVSPEGSKAGFTLTLSGICAILTIIASIVLLAVGTVKLLKELSVNVPVLDQYQAVVKKVEAYTLLGNLVVQIVSFICLLIFGISNSESIVSVHPAVGAYLLLILAIAAFLLVKYVFKGDAETVENEENTIEKQEDAE
jgi:hypothetical protein